MMRNFLVLVMLTVYSASAIGVPLHYHYCKGELQHVSLFTQKECDEHETHQHKSGVADSPFACCLASHGTDCSMDEPECCDDESDLIQLSDEAVAMVYPFSAYPKAHTVLEVLPDTPATGDNAVAGFDANAPPALGLKLYLSHCSFVFYG